MSDMTIFAGGTGPVPAHIAAFLGSVEENIVERPRTPTLNYAGKKWTVILPDGSKNTLTRKNDDGDVEPVQILRVVIPDYHKSRGRTYYAGAYDPDKTGAPDCWSDDGKAPDASVQEPQHTNCANCPMSVKGSRITDSGKQVKACSEHRNIAVIPTIGNMALGPLRLKLSITSLFDKQSPELEAQGWRAFENYLDFLRGNGVKHTGAILTKIKFDPNTDYPKVIFSAERWLDEDEMDQVQALMSTGKVSEVLQLAPPSESEPAPKAVEPEKPAPTKAKPEPAPKVAVEEEPAPTKKAKPAPVVVEATPEPKAEPKQEVPAVTADIPEDLAAMLSDWDDG
jgi:hypothetical protein